MTQEFQREYLLRLPLPLAQLYSRAYNAKDARGRHDNTFYLFEALVKVAAAPAIGAYVHEIQQGGPRTEALDRLLVQLALPSLGQWLAMLRELARYFGSRADAAVHPLGHLGEQLKRSRRDLPAVLALYCRIKNGVDGQPGGDQSCSLLQLLDGLVQYRNGVFGHGAGRFASFYEQEMGPLLFPAVNELLAEGVLDVLGPRGSRLVHVTELRTLDDGQVEVGLRELVGLQGERMAPLLLSAEQAKALAPNRVALLWPGRPVPLRLDPLLLYRESELADEVLFLNRDRNSRQVEYLSYTTGRTERDKSHAPALAALLSCLTNRSNGAVQLQALAEQSLAETPSVEILTGGAVPAARLVGDYEILAEIGRGGMGVVYLARQQSLGRLVALKMLPADLAGDEVALARFRREVRALARCDHLHIVKVLSSGTLPDGQLYYAMEYVSGCDLEMVWRELSGSDPKGDISRLGSSTWARAVLSATKKQRGQTSNRSSAARTPEPTSSTASGSSSAALPLPPLPELPSVSDDPGGYVRRVVRLVRDAALALQAVHDQNLVHRDVKPANLMLTADGQRIVLMDFGLAKGQSLTLSASKQGGLLGTLRYAAPEQLAARSLKVGPQADVRGLGITLWELLTLRRIFAEAEDEKQLAQLVHDEDVPRLRSIDSRLDADLEAIVARATERRVADRIQSAGQLADYLQLYLDGRPLPIRPPSTAEMVWRWVREHKPLVGSVAAAGLVVFLTVVIAFVLITGSKNEAVRSKNEAVQLATEKTELAQENGKLADKERQAREAVQNTLEKIKEERQRAETEKQRAVEQRDRAERLVYYGQIALAQREWQDNEVAHARELLDGCRWDLRGWEHGYLHHLFDSNQRTFIGHRGAVKSVAFSPDGSRIASSSNDGTKVWDTLTGRQILTFGAYTSYDQTMAFSPDGERIVCGSNQDGALKVWDAHTGQQVLTIKGHAGPVFSVSYSPDGKLLASGSLDKTLKVWDAQTGRESVTLKGHTDTVESVTFSPDSKRIVSGSWDKTLKLWDMYTGQEILTFMGHTRSIRCVAFSPDGKRIASASDDGSVKVWDGQTGQETYTLKRRTGSICHVVFSPDGTRILGGSSDGTLTVWDAQSGQEAFTLKGHTEGITSVAFSRDGAQIVSGSLDKTMKVWDAQTRQETVTIKQNTRIVSTIAFSSDGKRLTGISNDGTVKLWKVRTGQDVATIKLKGNTGFISSAVFSPDGQRIASVAQTLKLWTTQTGQEIFALKEHTSGIELIAFSPDGKRLAGTTSQGTLEVWDAQTGKEIINLQGHKPTDILASTLFTKVRSIAFSPDGKRLVSGSVDKTLKLWDVQTGQEIVSFKGHQGEVYCVTFSPDGKRIASGSNDNTLKVWDADTGREILNLLGHTSHILSVAYSPDGKRIVSGSGDKTLKIWDAQTGEETFVLKGHILPALSVAFSPDGKLIASNSGDGTIKIWDAQAGPQALTRKLNGLFDHVQCVAFSPDGNRITCGSNEGWLNSWDAWTGQAALTVKAHTSRVSSVAYSADGRFLASGGLDGMVKVSDVQTNQEVLKFKAHTAPILSIAFSPDGRLASGSYDRTVKLWSTQTGQEILTLKEHTDAVNSVAFSRNGTRLASADGTLKVWDAYNGQEVLTLKGRAKGFLCMAFTPDGKQIATGSPDGKIRLWNAQDLTEIVTFEGHTGAVLSLAFSPDAQRLASGGVDRTLKVWDIQSGQEVHRFIEPISSVNSVAFSPDGKRIISGGDRVVEVWDLGSP